MIAKSILAMSVAVSARIVCGPESMDEAGARTQVETAMLNVVSESYQLDIAQRGADRSEVEVEQLTRDLARAQRHLKKYNLALETRSKRVNEAVEYENASQTWQKYLLMKREGKDIECVEVEEAAEVNKKAKKQITRTATDITSKVYPATVVDRWAGSVDGFSLVTRKVKEVAMVRVKSLEERKEECQVLMGPTWMFVAPVIAAIEPECPVDGEKPLPPKFDGTLRPKRHSNSFPWTYEWKTHKNVERTELLFKTVNHETKKFEVRSEDAQKFVLTEANTQADLPQYGSIDVEVTSITGCGERSEPVKTVVCDTDIRVSPKIDFSSDYGPKGGNLEFDWAVTPADQVGHMYKLTWYTVHVAKTYAFVGKVSKQSYCKGTKANTCMVDVDNALSKMKEGDEHIMFTLMAVNRCIQVSPVANFMIYKRTEFGLKKVNFTIDAEDGDRVTLLDETE